MLKGHKTMIFAFVLCMAGIAEHQWKALQPLLTPDTYGIGLFVIGLIVGGLRIATTTPYFQDWFDIEDQGAAEESAKTLTGAASVWQPCRPCGTFAECQMKSTCHLYAERRAEFDRQSA